MVKAVKLFLVLSVMALLAGCGNNSSVNNTENFSENLETEEELPEENSSDKASEMFWGLDKEEKKHKSSKKESEIIIEHDDSSAAEIVENNNVDEASLENQKPEDNDFDSDIKEENKKADNSGKRVICWGDSMTTGFGGNGFTYPDTLAKESGAEVLNYGVFAETTKDIAAREGAIPMFTSSEGAVNIPADLSPVELSVSSSDGWRPQMTIFGNAGVNPCKVGNVEGNFYHDDNTGDILFVRNKTGSNEVIPDRTPFTTFASTDHREDDIVIIWSGNNEAPETEEAIRETIYWQKEMIKHSGAKKYAIISLTTKPMLTKIDLINEMYKKEYGEHFIDLRSYVLGDMMEDAGITPTSKDLEYVKTGYVPPSLSSSDEIHGNALFYEYAGRYIYKCLKEMGYLE